MLLPARRLLEPALASLLLRWAKLLERDIVFDLRKWESVWLLVDSCVRLHSIILRVNTETRAVASNHPPLFFLFYKANLLLRTTATRPNPPCFAHFKVKWRIKLFEKTGEQIWGNGGKLEHPANQRRAIFRCLTQSSVLGGGSDDAMTRREWHLVEWIIQSLGRIFGFLRGGH